MGKRSSAHNKEFNGLALPHTECGWPTAILSAVGALYLLAVALLTGRYSASEVTANNYLDLAIQQGAEPIGSSNLITLLCTSVFLFGTLLALWFL